MQAIRYRRHFLTLIPAAMALWLITRIEDVIPAGGARWLVFFGAIGAFHSASLLISLRDKTWITPWKAIIFVTLVSALSVVAPAIPLFLLPLTTLGGATLAMLFAVTFASALGASGYWLLLRFFWLKSLRLVSLMRTMAMCCAATLLGWLSAGSLISRARDIGELVPTFAWWAAFSFSLYCGEAQWRTGKSIPAPSEDTGV